MEYPKHISFRCEAEVEQRIRIEAAKMNLNRSEFILEAIEEKLARIDAQNILEEE